PRACTGARCSGGRPSRPPRQFNPSTQARAAQMVGSQYHAYPIDPRAAPEAHLAAQPLHGWHGDSSSGTRIRAHEVLPAGCTGEDCVTPVKQFQPTNNTRDCRGIECRLPLIIRPKARAKSCAEEGCLAGSEETVSSTASQLPPVHLSDRAAQFMGDFPEFGYPSSELGGAPLGVQLTCDIKPENEVHSEDALVLHLQLAKGQEKLVEALRTQQMVIRDLQQKLVDQQEALLSQQREVLEQQRRMYEQMDVVKAQYALLSDTVKQVSFQSLQGELQSYFESHLAGLQSQARSHLQKSYAGHKMDMDSKVMDVVGEAEFPQPLLGCTSTCGPEEFCDFQRVPPQCQKCTMCPPGFFLISQCSPTADRMCQDRDECLELPNICGERVKCLNSPGFKCLGVPEREAVTGLCGHNYFYNQELQECQACSDCDGDPVTVPCTAICDTVCGHLSESRLSQAWAAHVVLPPPKTSGTNIFPGLQLNILGKETSDLLSNNAGQVTFLQHGLVWLDHNVAIKHSCRNFLQVGMRLNGSQEEEGRDLSGVRIEQPDGKYFQGVSVSSGVEVEPNHVFSLLLKSPNQHCNQSKDLHIYDVITPSLSLLWLSHDTGAVSMTAQMSLLVHYQTSYRPTFRITSVSDPYMISLTHDNRGVRFTESGVVKFVLQQALYSMGHTCIQEGLSLIAYTNQNGTGQETTQAFKIGVNYRDTSITLSGAVSVDSRDALSFEITSPSQCNVRYFGDGTGISMLSLIWIPSAMSSALTATVSRTGLPFGAVRNKPLLFEQISSDTPQVHLARSGEPNTQKNFIFHQKGTANIALNLKLIHSCNIVKLTLQRVGVVGQGEQSGPVAQQVTGYMPEGSEWASIGLRASFQVQNGTAVYVTLDCIRGRVNQITHAGGTNISLLWVAM
uniref:TNFR-Cys domain-containing protein n=1 Tax=Monopterus albus TaxID=43700 RepID=A0A3Q3JSQ7_MONAL